MFFQRQILQTYIFRKPLSLCVISALLSGGLSSCGGTGQDSGNVASSSNNMNLRGVAIDGRVARATVFADSNNNGARDPWESYAFTDNDGYYSFNPLTNTNYCAQGVSAQEQQYCLVLRRSLANVVIRIDGGYDISTNEPMFGQMSRRVNLDTAQEDQSLLISPLTTLVTDVDDGNRSSFLDAIGVSESDLDVNYLDTDSADVRLLNKAIKVHKVVSILSDRLTDTYDVLGDELGTPNDATSHVYPQLAREILSSGVSLENVLETESRLLNVLDQSEGTLRNLYEEKEFDLPQDLGSVNNAGDFSRTLDVAVRIPDVVDVLVNTQVMTQTVSELVGGLKGLESVVIKSLDEVGLNNDIDTALNFFTDTENTDLIEALTRSLEGELADVATLAQSDFRFETSMDVEGASSLPTGVMPFRQMAGKTLRVSELDFGYSPNNLRDSQVELYFEGSSDALSGPFVACIKYIDGANVDGTLGEANTRGELADGYWSLLGNAGESSESYSLLLTITFLGATYQAIMKPAGQVMIENVGYEVIRFDNDGEFGEWFSENGVVTTSQIPNSNEECEARLPSRVGL